MGNKVTFDGVNKIIQVTQAPSFVGGEWVVDLDIKVDVYSDGKEDWITDSTLNKLKFPIEAVGGQSLPGSKKLGTTYFFNYGWRLRPYEASHTLRINGNLYTPEGESPFIPTVGTYNVFLIQQVSSLVDSTVQQLEEIEYISFDGAVHVDATSGITGVDYPNGNAEYPVDNIPDAVSIANTRGFNKLHIIGNYTFDTGDNIDNFIIIGENPTKSTLVINAGASTVGTEIQEATVTGILDGGTVLRECLIVGLNYVNGYVYHSILGGGTITLGGDETAYFIDCMSGVVGLGATIINLGGSGQDLQMRNYSGGIELENLTGSNQVSIDMSSGRVKLASTMTGGAVYIRGICLVEDFSEGTDVIKQAVVSQIEVNNIQRLIELTRPHHTGLGNIWYWDPVAGSDSNDGTRPDAATLTFAKAHDLVVDGNHDIIVCTPGEPSGVTVADEVITITKRYLFVRGPGRDFHIKPTSQAQATITVNAPGVEISSIVVSTADGSNDPAIQSNTNFTLVKDAWMTDCGVGVYLNGGEYHEIHNCKLHHNTGHGIEIVGDIEHIDIIDCHIGSNTGDGVRINTASGHEVNFVGDNIIHNNTGYGINIIEGEGIHIQSTSGIFNNITGDIFDNGVNTYYQEENVASRIVDKVWNANTSAHTVAGTFGHFIQKKILTVSKFLGLK